MKKELKYIGYDLCGSCELWLLLYAGTCYDDLRAKCEFMYNVFNGLARPSDLKTTAPTEINPPDLADRKIRCK